MICCGSGSDFEKVFRIQTILSTVFQKIKIEQKLAFSMSEAALFI
jgi:hypothetical protein